MTFPRLTHRIRPTKFFRAYLAILMVFSVLGYSKVRAATLADQLQRHAPEILRELSKRDCRRIGVLKFRVVTTKGRAPSDNAGTLNMLLADRLEVALALANPHEPDKQFQLIRNASAVADKHPKANHLTAEGIKTLFAQQYPMAWGTERTSVDAFVTGVVQVAPDLRSLRIGLSAIVRNASRPESILQPIVVDTDGAVINEIGESFQLRDIFSKEDTAQDAAASARQVRNNPAANFPLEDKPAVALRIYYDGQPVDLKFTETEATIPEPRKGQRVRLEIERMDRATGALGVVLKVNGENTLYRQRMRNCDCAKWILNRENLKTTIHGFQRLNDEKIAEAFEVASLEESRTLEMYYGRDVGTISMVVFKEALEPPKLSLDDDAVDFLAIDKAIFPAEPPLNSDALKAQLRESKGDGMRSVIKHGSNIEQKIRLNKHNWNPDPVASIVIRYYRPKN